MWMCAGFTMLEAGSMRTKNASVIWLKNIRLYAFAGLKFYVVGYNIMYVDVEAGGWFGSLALLYETSAEEVAMLQGGAGITAAVVKTAMRRCRVGFSGWCSWPRRPRSCPAPWSNGQSCGLFWFSLPCSRQSSIRSSAPGYGAADGSPKWISMTSPDRPSCLDRRLGGAFVVGARRGKFR